MTNLYALIVLDFVVGNVNIWYLFESWM